MPENYILHLQQLPERFDDALEGVTPAANDDARRAKSAADSAAFEAAEKLYGENARINDKLSNE